ncbi:RNA-directed DNA polymerase, eukaryota, reverse transcriptase zinc-binding domain protein [Tanacetum coccineum]
MTTDMCEFRDYVNNIKVEDIASSGLFYTWTKNLFKVKSRDTSRVLKKLDKLIGNEEFIDKFPNAHAIFLPYLISDHSLNIKIDKNPDSKQLREEESSMLVDYVEAMKDEEKILFQKAKIKWLCLGDKNNSYFHKVLKSRMNRSIINQISDDKVQNLDDIGSLISHKLSTKDAANMVRDISNEDIKSAMFSINSNKAPGQMASPHISLRKLRALWCISKILTDRMKTGLGKIVDLNQSAFVPNRHIQDNILLSQELLKGYDRKDGPKRIAIKIDLQKAYDTVNWQFLEAMIVGFTFHNKMVNWIIKCVTTASFSICVNGERFGYFKGGRGLRQ